MKKRKILVSILAGVMAAVMLLTLVLSLLPTRVSAASSSEIRKQINALKEEKKEMQAEIDEIKSQVKTNENKLQDLVSQKDAIDREIALLYEQIDNVNQQLAAYALLIADKQDELDTTTAHLEELNQKNKERIRAMEEEGAVSYWSVIFKANNFSDLLDRLNMIQEIAESDRKRIEEMSVAAEAVVSAQQELANEKTEIEAARAELDETQELLDQKRAEADELMIQLIAEGDEFKAMLAESMDMAEELAQEIADKEKDFKDAQYKEYMATYVPPATRPSYSGGDTTPSVQVPSSSGWLVPVPYYTLTSPFGTRVHPISGVKRMHKGMDMACAAGTPIYASRAGVVTTASNQPGGAGIYVSINHGDGFSSIYMHMTRYIVSAGQHVNAGQVIGYVGSTGASTGPHLHFGIAYNGTYINPAPYIS